MNKTIIRLEERKKKVLSREIERLEKDYYITSLDYRDTGRGWYFNKMQRIENDLAELIAYRDREDQIRQEYLDLVNQKRRLNEKLSELKSKVLYLTCDLKDMGIRHYRIINTEEFLENFKID